jgi:hypothetical protein
VPDLPATAARELAATSVVLLAGLWPFAHPAQAVQEATKDPRLAGSRISFADMFSRDLHLVATGLIHLGIDAHVDVT